MAPGPPYRRALSTRFTRTWPMLHRVHVDVGHCGGHRHMDGRHPGPLAQAADRPSRGAPATPTLDRCSARLACSACVRSSSSSTRAWRRAAARPIRSTDRRCGRRVQPEVEQAVDVARDERERGPQLMRDRREEARPQLLGGPLGTQVPEHHHGALLVTGHGGERGCDGDLRPVLEGHAAAPPRPVPPGSPATSSKRHRSPHRSPPGSAQRNTVSHVAPACGTRPPRSGTAARLTRTTRRRSSTATIPSVVPSRIAARSACSPASSSRSWAARKAMASS